MSWTNRAIVEISSEPPDAVVPAWVDITSYVADASDTPGWRVADGRQDATSVAQPGRLTLALRNGVLPSTPARFTPRTDEFTRVVVGGLGAATSGETYTLSNTPADHAVDGTQAVITPATLASDYQATLLCSGPDFDTQAKLAIPSLPATGTLRIGLSARYAPSNLYWAELQVLTSAVVLLRLMQRVAGVSSELAGMDTGWVHSPTVARRMRLQVVGGTLRVMAWTDGESPPRAWALSVPTTSLPVGNEAGLFARNDTASTTHTFVFDELSITDVWFAAGRFTPGNVFAPTYPWFGQSCRIRLYESIGPERFEHHDGFVEWPESSVVIPDVDQSVSITAVDRLGRLQAYPTFVSTLGALIESDPTLDLYYPLTEEVAHFEPRKALGGPIVPRLDIALGPAELDLMVFPADQAGPAGDDVSYLRLAYPFDPSSGATALVAMIADLSVTVGSGESIALSAWLRTTDSGAGVFESLSAMYLYGAGGAFLEIDNDRANGISTAYGLYGDPVPTYDSTVETGDLPTDVWRLVTVRLTLPSGTVDYWVGSDPPVSPTGSGSPPSSMTFTELHIAEGLFGSVGQVQVRAGAGVMPREQHLAQFEHGLTGLERQRTGERVETICAYAGLPAGIVQADRGVAVMQRAQLAGKTPLAALQEAETTEQGRLSTHGERVVFHDRRRRYDI